MLHEFALSPAIFRATSYESSTVADLCLKGMCPSLLDDCLVRNLHDGSWLSVIREEFDSLHPKARELIKKLEKQGRLTVHEAILGICPKSEVEWESEALSSHERTRLAGMIFTKDSKAARHLQNRFVESPEGLTSAEFWKNRPCSLRIPRMIGEYAKLLKPVLCHANIIAFMDPHLDPTQDRYKEFLEILTHPALAGRNCKPVLEIHRVATIGSGSDKKLAIDVIVELFREWAEKLKHCGITANIHLWDEFHDRFVASDLLSMTWSNGFDTTTSQSARVTVSRLSRDDRDELQKEFGLNSCLHKRLKSFSIGA